VAIDDALNFRVARTLPGMIETGTMGQTAPYHVFELLPDRQATNRQIVIFLLEIPGFFALKSASMPDPRNVVVYSRKGCHLCEVVKESLSKLSRRGGFTWREIDVDADLDLRRQFNDEVPVVFIDGRKAFKYRMDEQEFLRKLAS
jgi:glutaredoxin